MANALPEQGGIGDWFTGSKTTLAEFAEGLKAFSPAFKEYADGLGVVSPEVVTSSANAGKALAEMASLLDQQGGLVELFVGSKMTLTQFANELAAFGPAFKGYADGLGVIKDDVVTSSINAAKSLIEMGNLLPAQGGFIHLFTGGNTLADFGRTLSTFGEHFVKYSGYIATLNFSSIYRATGQLKQLVDIAKEIAPLDINKVGKFGEQLKKLGLQGIDGFISAFDGSLNKIKEQAVKTGNSFIEGVRSMMSKFEQIGRDTVEGFVKGIIGNLTRVVLSGKTLSKTLIDVVTESLKIESPSRVFYELGRYVDQGFANGIRHYSTVAQQASETMGKEVIDTMARVVSTIAGTLSADLDSAPTIRPVLDLTGVNSNMGLLNSMLGNRTFGLAAMINQNGSVMSTESLLAELNLKNSEANKQLSTTFKEDMAHMISAIENLKVVMDTGRLVVQLVPGMDYALGNRAVLNRRGTI
jgi:hypothetical protein